ncbi:MAG: hypothetical protein CL844_02035 [Crocinitomicaceae bacterium]|nr:hypothetical protein [Crocinitomicaceae bacterium]|tara:strand:+ start:17331 stop:18254 length:924 start_codon:yes stop_codon:yes gene_type:complete
MTKILYYLFIIPLSYLPLKILYIISDFLYLLITYIIPYRKKIVEKNIDNSFPEKSAKEKKIIKLQFYRHLTDLLAEGIKSINISKNEINNRVKITNPELMDELYKKKKDVILVSGHYNNWEWIVKGLNLFFKHKAIGIGMPLSSKFWDKKMNESRSKFSMTVVNSMNYKNELLNSSKNEIKSILLLGDQSPSDSNKSYWMTFLNQDTPVLFGTEMIAHDLNYSVVFLSVKKIKRGYYSINLNLITHEPHKLNWGEITEAHTKLLEKEIISKPQYWLWSHKRWKREIPKDLNKLKIKQKEKFNSRFYK